MVEAVVRTTRLLQTNNVMRFCHRNFSRTVSVYGFLKLEAMRSEFTGCISAILAIPVAHMNLLDDINFFRTTFKECNRQIHYGTYLFIHFHRERSEPS